jgi:ubiquinone/menaquinone biosynthesis C-methylase UbiE
MNKKIYPDSGIELTPLIAKYYDSVMNLVTMGIYKSFIKKVITEIDIQPGDKVLDLGCGTGRNAKLMSGYLNDKGQIAGLDISKNMEKQFLIKFRDDKRVKFINQRIDQLLDLQQTFDKVLISFVIHGFPHEVRDIVIKNAAMHLKSGGSLYILDYSEFDMDKMPPLHRFIFRKVECKYAFDYLKRDWKEILKTYGFDDFKEHLHLKEYVRLLKAVKQ